MRVGHQIERVRERRKRLVGDAWQEVARARTALARLPLRWRLAGVSLGLLLVLILSLGIVTVFFERQTLYSDQAAALRSEAQLAVRAANGGNDQGGPLATLVPPNTTPPPVGPSPAVIGIRLDVLNQRLAGATTSVVVYLPDGTLINTSDDVPQAPRAAQAPPSVVDDAATNAHSAGWYVTLTNFQGQRQIATLLPIEVEGQTALVVQIATPTHPIDSAVNATRLMLLVGMLVALLIGGVVTPPLVSAALRPLEEMERASARISGSELTLRLEEPPTQDEIGRLARSFNRMVARLENAFARQKRFVADVSHELRTPLTALGGGMEMLLIGAEAGDPEASRRLLRGMYSEVERMRRLVDDLLTLARLDEGRMELRLERLDPAALMTGVYEQTLQLERGQEIRCEIASQLPEILVDADRVRQVLLNLVDNALKFTPPPGVVTLRAYPTAGDIVVLEVEDTGQGIPESDLPHIFERFFRVDPSRVRPAGHVGGSGLGLAIAKSLVEASGGTIAITSAEGKGTRVTVRFPVMNATSVPRAPGLSLAAPLER